MLKSLLFLLFLYSCNANFLETEWELLPLEQLTSGAYFRIKIDGVYKDSGTLAVLSLNREGSNQVSGLANETLVHYEFQRNDGNGDWDVFYPGTTGSHDGQVFTLEYKETDDSDAIQLIPSYYIFKDNDDGVYEYDATSGCQVVGVNTGFHSELTNPLSYDECLEYFDENKNTFTRCINHPHVCEGDGRLQTGQMGGYPDFPRGCIIRYEDDGGIYNVIYNYLVSSQYPDGAPEVGECGMRDASETLSCAVKQCGGLSPCTVFNSAITEECKCYDTDITTGQYCHGGFHSDYALCTNTDGTESLSPCVCYDQVEVDSTNIYCHSTFVSQYPECPIQNGTGAIVSTCFCNGSERSDGYCHETFWSPLPICDINKLITGPCYCNGDEINSGYCQVDHTTDKPYCDLFVTASESCYCILQSTTCNEHYICDAGVCTLPECSTSGDQLTNVCSCNGECYVGNRCIDGSCVDTCPIDVIINLPCMCNGVEITDGICKENGHLPLCDGNLPCLCGGIEISDGFCHDGVQSQFDLCDENVLLTSQCYCSMDNVCNQNQYCNNGLCIDDLVCDTTNLDNVEYDCSCMGMKASNDNADYDESMTSEDCEAYAEQKGKPFSSVTGESIPAGCVYIYTVTVSNGIPTYHYNVKWNEDSNGILSGDPQCDMSQHSCVYKSSVSCAKGGKCYSNGVCTEQCDDYDGTAKVPVNSCNCGGSIAQGSNYYCNYGWLTLYPACSTGNYYSDKCSCNIENGNENLCEDGQTCLNGECLLACADNVELTEGCLCGVTEVSTGYCHDDSFHSDYSRCSEGETGLLCACSDGNDCAVGDICSDGKCHCDSCTCHLDIETPTGCKDCFEEDCVTGQTCSFTSQKCLDDCPLNQETTTACICKGQEINSGICVPDCILDSITDETCVCQSETCQRFETCSGSQCTAPPTCSDGVEISQPCSCNGVYIQAGFCHSGVISEFDICTEPYVEPTTLTVQVESSEPFGDMANSRVQWGIRNKATGADLASGIAGETETITLNYGTEYEAYGTEIPDSYEALGQTNYIYSGWSNSKLTITHDGDQILSFSGPGSGNNGVEATETFTVAIPSPPTPVNPPCFCDSSCPHPDCSGSNIPETNCLCDQTVIENGYCHGTYSSDYPLCTDNQIITSTCICNGVEISSGYCHGTYSSDKPNCDGDTRPCSCAQSLECVTDEVCNGGICEIPACVNNQEITFRCICHGEDKENGWCYTEGYSQYGPCTLDEQISSTCSCHGEDKENGWCHTEGYSQYEACTLDEEITSMCFCLGEDREVGRCNTDGYSYDYLFTFKTSGAPDPTKMLTEDECDAFGLHSESYPRPQNIGVWEITGAKPAGCLLRTQFDVPYYRPDDGTASGDCSEEWQCIEWIETPIRPCANNQEITSACKCNGQEISSGYCHGTYSSDKPNCDGDTRPCSCSSGNDCVTDEVCIDGTCDLPLVDRIELITENLPDLTKTLTQSECQDVYDNIYNEGHSMTVQSNSYNPYGCQLHSGGSVYFNTKFMSPTECSSSKSCIKWKTDHVPISDCDTGYNARECTCNGTSCSAGKVCDGTCEDPYDDLFTFKTSGASDPIKMLTADECDAFGLNSVFYPRDTVTAEEGEYNTKPHGCLLRSAWLRPYYSSGGTPGDCSEEWQCIEWIEVPAIRQCAINELITSACKCNGEEISSGYCHWTYSSDKPNCDGDTRPCSCIEGLDCSSGYDCNNGICEIPACADNQEITSVCVCNGQDISSGYCHGTYSSDKPNCDGDTRPCSCIEGLDCSSGYDCNNGICEIPACADNQEITSVCICNGVEISSGYCHGTYSSDYPTCDGITRPCSCIEGLDCVAGEACTGGTCETAFDASYIFRDSGKYDSSKMLSYEECETFAQNSESAGDPGVYSAGGGKPAGCSLQSSGWVRWQLEDRGDCSETYNCVEWIDPPIDDCGTEVIFRGCTCGSVTCGHGGTCENDVCIPPLIDRIELRTENAVDMTRAMTESECQDVFDSTELSTYDQMLTRSQSHIPYGCQIHSNGVIYYNSGPSNTECSTDYECIEWKTEYVPIVECGTGLIYRECTCDGASCSAGKVCDGTCQDPYDDLFTFRSSGASDPSKALTTEECDTYAQNSVLAASTSVYSAGNGKPAGCSLQSAGWVRWQLEDRGNCSETYNCVEWIDPPIIDCPNADGYNYRDCICHSPTTVDVTYDSQTYNICDGDTVTVTWNGYHNIQEVTQSGYNSYDASEHIGSQIHGFENNGHSEVIDGLHATAGETRYFVCTLHPAKKFTVTCSTCLSGQKCDAINNQCLSPCANHQEITSACVCHDEDISSGYCHETYSSDNPKCDGDTRPCSCIEGLDCSAGQFCSSNFACISECEIGARIGETCLCNDEEIYYRYCHGTYSSDYPTCDGDIRPCSCIEGLECSAGYDCNGGQCVLKTCENNQEITSPCDCNGEEISSGYCHGTFSSDYPLCTDNQEITSPCVCNGEEISSGYCHGTYSSDKPNCDGDTRPCSCIEGLDCSAGYDCNNGICELQSCANNQEITSPCGCNGEEISSGYCHGTYSSDKPNCDGDTRPCSCSLGNDCITFENCNDGICEKTYDAYFTIRSSGAPDPSKSLTTQECDTFSQNSIFSKSNNVYTPWGTAPSGCILQGDGAEEPSRDYIRYQETSEHDCSTDWWCIEWIEVPTIRLCTNNELITSTCDCNGEEISSGYCHGTYSSDKPDCDGDTRPCSCIEGLDCSSGYDCMGGQCVLKTCQNNQEITSTCSCNGEEISSGYCYGTYSSDKPNCDGDTRPCSCSSGNECVFGEDCNDGICETVSLEACPNGLIHSPCTCYGTTCDTQGQECFYGICRFPACPINQEITAICACGDETISSGYCHETYSSDKPNCDDDTRPCSCIEGLDCQSGEYCTDGVCSSAFTQTITIQADKWTWISIGVTLSDDSITSVIPVAEDGDKIQSQSSGTATMNDYTAYGYGFMWTGTLSKIPQYQMLKVNFASETTLSFTGNPDNEMTISTGWKWIGIPAGDDILINDLFPGEWEDGDKIQSQSSGTATMNDYTAYGYGFMWTGTLTKIVPGVGYKINKQTGGTYTIR